MRHVTRGVVESLATACGAVVLSMVPLLCLKLKLWTQVEVWVEPESQQGQQFPLELRVEDMRVPSWAYLAAALAVVLWLVGARQLRSLRSTASQRTGGGLITIGVLVTLLSGLVVIGLSGTFALVFLRGELRLF